MILQVTHLSTHYQPFFWLRAFWSKQNMCEVVAHNLPPIKSLITIESRGMFVGYTQFPLNGWRFSKFRYLFLSYIHFMTLYQKMKTIHGIEFQQLSNLKLSFYLLGLNGLHKYVSGSPFLFEQIVPLSRLTSSDHFGFYCYKSKF